MHSRLAVIAIGSTMLVLGACTQEPTAPGPATSFDPADAPGTPTDVMVEVSPDQVVVSWTLGDTSGVNGYRVYRAVGTGGFALLGTTTNQAFTDSSVETGQTYRYRVSSVRDGLEGLRSVTVTAVPNVFAIVLDGGVEVTAANSIAPGSRKILVGLVAPATTVSFRLSENASLAGASVQSYDALNPVGLFTLSAGDGPKIVYAQFVDADGATSETVSATIILDTKAVILGVTEDSAGAMLTVGSVLHVAVMVDTTGGTVTVSLEGVLTAAPLFDDGTHGDAVAADGTYERDFTIPAGAESYRGVVTAAFRDQVGNDAAAGASATRVDVADPPAAPTWETHRFVLTASSAELFWVENQDPDFDKYRILRSPRVDPLAPDPAVTATSDVAAVFTNRSTVSFTDNGPPGGFPGGGKYTWGVVAIDDNGYWSTIATTTQTLP